MKYKYTDQDISLFYERFKQLPEYFELEKVRQLINNPNAKAMQRIKINYKPSKLIIMTSAINNSSCRHYYFGRFPKNQKTERESGKQPIQIESSHHDMRNKSEIQSAEKGGSFKKIERTVIF